MMLKQHNHFLKYYLLNIANIHYIVRWHLFLRIQSKWNILK